jgi:peptidoglycan-associated lipoprotein
MQINTLLKVVFLSLVVTALSACSSVKHKNAEVQEGVQTVGLEEENGFADENSPNRLKAPYNQIYHFDFDSYSVHADDTASINAQANYLMTHSEAKIRLEGNADERGSREYNIALGWKRAKAVAEVLKQQGVTTSQIAMVSFGKEKPIALGHDEESYAQNRRVTLVYESK